MPAALRRVLEGEPDLVARQARVLLDDLDCTLVFCAARADRARR